MPVIYLTEENTTFFSQLKTAAARIRRNQNELGGEAPGRPSGGQAL